MKEKPEAYEADIYENSGSYTEQILEDKIFGFAGSGTYCNKMRFGYTIANPPRNHLQLLKINLFVVRFCEFITISVHRFCACIQTCVPMIQNPLTHGAECAIL